MKYRLLYSSDPEGGSTEIVLTQKLKNFDPRRPAVISIKAVLKRETPLSNAVLSDEFEIEFEEKQIAKIGGLLLEEVLDFEKDFKIDFNFLSANSASYDALEAEIIE